MGTPYLGEIRMFGGNFAPAGWAYCDGSLLPISEFDALFTLIGTTYGGDGAETFALPSLQSRVPIHRGPNNVLGQAGGVEAVTLISQQMPAHTHAFVANTSDGTSNDAQGHVVASSPNIDLYYEDAPATNLNQAALFPDGGSQPHDNMLPFQAINFIISLYGIFPPQS
jgi:microcystin-dependent protein